MKLAADGGKGGAEVWKRIYPRGCEMSKLK